MKTFKTTSLMLACGFATLALAQPALALDAQEFADRLVEVSKVQGFDVTFGPAALEGDTITIQGGTIVPTDLGEEPQPFDTVITFTGVEEFDDGSYYAETMSVPDIDIQVEEEPKGQFTLSDIKAEGIYLPPAGETSFQHMIQTVERFSTGPLTFTADGKDLFKIDSMEVVSDFTFEEETLTDVATSASINGIWANLSIVAEMDPDSGAMIAMLGIEELRGDITQTGTWSLDDGHFIIEDARLDFADLGALSFKADFTGLTPALIDKVAKIEQGGPDTTPEEAEALQQAAGMELLQALVINSGSVRYDDASLATKLLDIFAGMSGASREDFVAGIKMAVPGMISEMGLGPVADLFVPAVNAFLDNPQSLEVSIEPATPTSILTLSAAASNPGALATATGLTVTANE